MSRTHRGCGGLVADCGETIISLEKNGKKALGDSMLESKTP